MTNVGKESVSIPPPEFVFDETIMGQEDILAIESLEARIKADPNFGRTTLDIYMEAPEVVMRAVQFIKEHPEGISLIEQWDDVVSANLDRTFLAFDRDTESEIEGDPYMRNLIDDRADQERIARSPVSKPMDAHRASQAVANLDMQIRKQRFNIYFRRLGDGRSAA